MKQQQPLWRNLQSDVSETRRVEMRRALLEQEILCGSLHALETDTSSVIETAHGSNCEQMVGITSVPVGVVGPITIDGKSTYVPLATTEGALVASVQRGSKATVKGITTSIEQIGTTRSIAFSVSGILEGSVVTAWVRSHSLLLTRATEATSSHLCLKQIRVQYLGQQVYVKFWFDTAEAMGMNMVTIAVSEAARVIENSTKAKLISISSNGCVDKKPAFENYLGRGHIVRAEAWLSADICNQVLHTTPMAICRIVEHKQWIGSMLSGSMGFNAHYANMVAAIYLATGQDIAHVVEGSLGITTARMETDRLYFSVYLPSIMVGVIGGGTRLPAQEAALRIMKLDQAKLGDRNRLAAYVGATVLCGELSLTAALAAGQLVSAHQRLGRKKHA
jgi:hydroxymethylglutaryl-CoA reductase (NADPH)